MTLVIQIRVGLVDGLIFGTNILLVSPVIYINLITIYINLITHLQFSICYDKQTNLKSPGKNDSDTENKIVSRRDF